MVESPLKRNLLPIEMLDTFRDVRLVSLMCHHRILNSASQSTHIAWLNYQILAIRHRLLSLSFDISDSRQAVLKCIQITTLLFIHTTDVDKIPAEASQSLIPQLENTLCHTDLINFWAPHSDILFWVLFFACYVAEGLPHCSWFEAQVARVANLLQLTEWEDVKSLMLEFFYFDCFHDVSFMKIWKRIRTVMGPEACHDGPESGRDKSTTKLLDSNDENGK
jgi:hypothetical protein